MSKVPRIWTGTGWDTLAVTLPDLSNYSTTTQMNTAIDNAKGLVLVKTQTIGTAVSSVTVTDAFSSAYANYRVVLSGGVASTNTSLRFQLNGVTSGWYAASLYSIFGGSIGGGNLTNNANGYFGFATTVGLSTSIDICNPNQALPKYAVGSQIEMATNGSLSIMGSYNSSTVQATDLIFFPNSGTLTGGTIRVYGYRNS